jgi:SAM-dependent methyltransferase
MDDHKEKDKKYHADIAKIYDYITNEPRQYPNELLFRPIDKLLNPAKTMLDLGCGTGQMFLRHQHLVDKVIAVDHSQEMIEEASSKSHKARRPDVTFIVQDLDDFLALNKELNVDLITCVGVLHHLDQRGMLDFLTQVYSLLNDCGQLLIAEPIYSSNVPDIVRARNAKSILITRLSECMPPDACDPDEEPLEEYNLLNSVAQAGFVIRKMSKGFELFHVTNPLSFLEKIIIKLIYWKHRDKGDVIALLLEKDRKNH